VGLKYGIVINCRLKIGNKVIGWKYLSMINWGGKDR
jgi:hypothetical protein